MTSKTSTRNMTATCYRDVPACLASDNQAVKHGDRFVVMKEFWRNGEGWLKLTDNQRSIEVPSVFFDLI